ncbi:MAG: BadF/BadG/BcrA/BcrD ATPase family protein [Eubacteriales bacterium]
MTQYVLGVDGGGTKTDCALFAIDGHPVDFLQWGPVSHEHLDGGYEACEREILLMLRTLLEINKILPQQIVSAVFGIAGVDTSYQKKKITQMIAKIALPNFIVCNDGFLGIKAGTSNGRGINVINGTGCSFQGINANGEMMQIGGQSVVMDDVAGGYIIGRQMIAMVHRELFLDGEKTALTPMLMHEAGVSSREELMDELVRRVGDKTMQIKHLSHLVFEAATQKDAVSLRYLTAMGHHMADYCKALIRSLSLYEEETIEIVLIGSAFLKAADKTHIKSMQEDIICDYPGAIFKPLEVRPVCGAVLWAFTDCGQLNPGIRENVLQGIE